MFEFIAMALPANAPKCSRHGITPHTSTGAATLGRDARADATREASALCGMETVVAPSKDSRNVPETALEMRMNCCSLIPGAPSHSYQCHYMFFNDNVEFRGKGSG